MTLPVLQSLGFWRVVALGLVFPPGLLVLVALDLADRLAGGQVGFDGAARGFAVVAVVFLGAVAWGLVVARLAGLL